MTATVEKNKTAAGYFLCRRSEATKRLEKAKTEAAEILKELKAFYTGDIGITAYINRHVMGCSVAGDRPLTERSAAAMTRLTCVFSS